MPDPPIATTAGSTSAGTPAQTGAEIASAAPPSSVPAAVGGSELGPPRARARNRSRRAGSTIVIVPGTRYEKGYPLTKDDLLSLGGLGLGTTAFFSVASASLSYYVNTGVNMALAQGVPKEVLGYYEGTRHWSLAVAIGCAVIGVAMFLTGGWRVLGIIKRTLHDG
jgi:hypothetical protein